MFCPRLLLVTTAAMFGCLDGSGAGELQPSRVGQALTVPELNANRASYVGQRVQVVGRLHAQPRLTDDGPDSTTVETFAATLHLLNPEEPTGSLNVLDLYTRGNQGKPEPLTCKASAIGGFECGNYIPDSVVTIGGTWTRQEMPAGQVMSPPNPAQTIARRTLYFLLVH